VGPRSIPQHQTFARRYVDRVGQGPLAVWKTQEGECFILYFVSSVSFAAYCAQLTAPIPPTRFQRDFGFGMRVGGLRLSFHSSYNYNAKLASMSPESDASNDAFCSNENGDCYGERRVFGAGADTGAAYSLGPLFDT